jgi:nicotinate-nucleotide adenylyltransferase
MESAELAAILETLLGRRLSAPRAEHSRGVAALAAGLCSRHGLDPLRGRIAGLAHDLCKELPKREQRALAALYPGVAGESGLLGDKIVHGPAAAALLARDYGLEDGDILEAVALHTLGRPGMGKLATIVYCADKLEPGRGHLDPAWRAHLLSLGLSDMLRETLGAVIAWLEAEGRPVAPESRLLYNGIPSRAVSE